jgi:hypothetical protein
MRPLQVRRSEPTDPDARRALRRFSQSIPIPKQSPSLSPSTVPRPDLTLQSPIAEEIVNFLLDSGQLFNNFSSPHSLKALPLSRSIPSGFFFGLRYVEWRGYYHLDPMVNATQETIHYFTGSLLQATTRDYLTGPIEGRAYTYRDSFDFETPYSPCGQQAILNLNTQLRVNNSGNKSGRGLITADAIEGLALRLFFQWQTCRAEY